MDEAAWVISYLKPKKREKTACDTTGLPFLTLTSVEDNAGFCPSPQMAMSQVTQLMLASC